GGNTRDLEKYMKSQGQTIPFTPLGAERYKKVDMAKNPNAYCLPPGPSRALTGPSPFFIVQHKDVVSFNFENHGVYRVVYINGKHPADIADYPQFMGHSTGKWEGDTLVVDTVGINDRTWLDSYGLEHSDKLHLTERFQKIGPDTIKYMVTYEDPVFFTKPWTATLNFVRQTHPGEEIGYILEGQFLIEQEGKPPATLRTGQTFLIPAGKVHNATNSGSSMGRLVATYVVEKGKPLATPAQ